jgi:Tfp pilus tip-associated adhesin PilY1
MFSFKSFKPLFGWVLLALALFACGARTASADDRDLLRATTGKPYVMIILDTSGSMNWTPPCTQAQFNAGQCQTLCPFYDCFARMQADDPSSKFYQAKQALYQVLKDVNDVQFGFATYNQDSLAIAAKHWIYDAGSGGISIPGSPNKIWPEPGSEEVFGDLWNCDNGSGNSETGCTAANPTDLDSTWDITRLRRLSKGGISFNQTVTGYIRWGGTTYRVIYTPVSGTLGGASITVNIDIDKCTNSSCSNRQDFGNKNIVYTLSFTNGKEDQFLSWENGSINTTSTSSNPTLTYFSGDTDSSAGNTCSGWDPNTDSSSDAFSSYSLRFPTATPQDSRGAVYTSGDVIPFDWLTDHKTDILKRLAPNQILNPAADPDFRIAPYLNDVPVSGQSYLRLKNDLVRPIISSGSTPLGASLSSFRTFYQTWKTTAAAQDPDWGCRRKYVLLITDGDETCSGSPCTVTSQLRTAEGVLTYVVAFGLQSVSGNTLSCMATNGGTGAPIYPQNKDELVAALTQIFGQIREQASSFASAAVPTVQTEVADKIYISNFTPLNGESIWNGHIDSYLKPLPLNAAGLPDRTINCPPVGSTSRSGCHLWDAATQLLNQAPAASDLATATTVDAGLLHLGLAGTSQRRVFYGKADPGTGKVPLNMRMLYPPPGAAATDADWMDLFLGFKFSPTPSTTAERNAAAIRATDIMKETLVIKSSTIQNGTATPIPVDYVLGDTFHADPTIIDRPNDFDRYAAQLYTNNQPCADLSTGKPQNPSYKCWADKLKRRRKIVAVAANDGQLHFFDAGIYRPTASPKPIFDDGTGNELFSFIPRQALPIVRSQAEGGNHIYALDSTPRVQEVFIDPAHTGTPLAADRQWRTVLIGGYREGGKPLGTSRLADFTSGYYALDITQPDTVDASGNPSQGLVPSCLTADNTVSSVATCGPVPYPALLWEFTDSLAGSRLDEDANGTADLGQTWSVPIVGRIQIKNSSNVIEDRYVAIVGGGLDADNKAAPKAGSYIYMIDIETGKVIYKQKLAGSIPADPAVIDNNADGVFDTIYIGTTAGFLYKIDMRTPVQLQPVSLATNRGIPAFATAQTVQRITDTSWLPVAIFDTGGKPIYYPPVAMFVSKLDSIALAFGTGDREDLWNLNNVEGRFYLMIDEGFTSAQNESSYQQITPTGASTTTDLVINPPVGKKRGWYLRLPANERVITKAFGLSGLIVFSAYQPQLNTSTSPTGPVCGRTGTSRVYTVYANNGNPVLRDPDTNLDTRFQDSDVFVAPPTVDLGSTKNPSTTQHNAATLTAEQVDIMNHLKSYFPASCKFGNFWYTISAMGSDTRYVGIAAIPMCIIEHNWKDVQ